jgi:alkylated DNA repair dioxygenase AlkB
LSQQHKQPSLFATVNTAPAGLRYYPDFISVDEEHELIDQIRRLPLVPFQFGVFEGKRRVAWFGWRYDYSQHQLKQADPIPTWIAPVIGKVESLASLPSSSIVQILCTEYDIGVGIGWHRDKPHFGDVFGLSLASACKLRFRRKTSSKWERFTLDALPRSLYSMTGEARHVWEHSIPAVQHLRYSITFRTMASGAT